MDKEASYHRFSDGNLIGESVRTEPSSYRVRVGDLGTVEIANGGAAHSHEEIDDESSIDENYDVVSLASSIDDHLT